MHSVSATTLVLALALPALGQDNMLKVKEGDMIPDITLPATGPKKEINVRGLNDKNVVLFFFPKANTPG